jgi:eukaryotic-like serine/threonine-protein kinase
MNASDDPTVPSSLGDTTAAPAPAISAGPVGPYRLLQKIGEGGVGQVWLAEQTTPIRRKVAFKLIKAGMDTKTVVARFESERQALALMAHPYVAKVFDAGSTTEGRPYFVMEYVPGLPIDVHCDKYRLTTEERLAVFLDVCDAVQHAHRKAIIHRDLKPSNILVTMEDGKSVPKIIDFGLAKAMAQRLTEKSLFTEVGAIVGTPEYMSPEQADLSDHEVDTRTDVYSLGLILYELLVGCLPYDARRFRGMGLDEVLRTIKEVEAPSPSSRFRRLGESSVAAAANRRTEPQYLARTLKGDLDRIVLKALEKNPARRYGSVSEFAADIRRYLRHEPVLATPAGVGYRTQKFVRRHRFGVSMAAALVLLLAAFAATMTVQARRIAQERDRANRQAEISRRVTDYLIGLFKVSDPGEARGRSITAREILDIGAKQIDAELRSEPEVQSQLMYAMGVVYRNLGLYGQAQSLLERTVESRRRVLGPEHLETLVSANALAVAYRLQGRSPDAEKLLRETLGILRRTAGPAHIETIRSTVYLARTLIEWRDAEAAELLRDMPDLTRRTLGPDHELTRQSTMYLAMADNGIGKLVEAEKLFREALDLHRRVLGTDHPDTLVSELNLSKNLMAQKRYHEAQQFSFEAMQTGRRILSPEHPTMIQTLIGLGWADMEDHRFAEADTALHEAFETSRRTLGRNHNHTIRALYNLACLAALQAKRDEAIATLQEAIRYGYGGADEMMTDDDLQSLRTDPRFNALVSQLRHPPSR